MSESALHPTLVWVMLGMAVVTFVALQWVTAPYGRHGRPGWGPSISSRLAWIVMESPAVFFFLAIYWLGQHRSSLVPLILERAREETPDPAWRRPQFAYLDRGWGWPGFDSPDATRVMVSDPGPP